ncbi:MAG: SDR family oxidoreductase [Desulfohalobiaceae bacterium]|nr:SDR family oxidoreductase [Desulfohalobiaceae bacterium]
MTDVYFVTGATGAVGAALIPELLHIPGARLKLLLRAGDRGHLRERFEGLLSFWGFGYQDVQERIVPLQGDATEPCFGLEQKDFEALSRECTHIIHCAGNVRMNLPLEEARRSALGSAGNVIELARRCREEGTLKKVEFVSTVGVGGRMQGSIPERFIIEEREFHNTYEQAKAEAEDYIRPHAEQGLPVTMHRPSMVVGDSQTGKIINFQVFYHICEFLSGRRTLGFVPDLQGVLLDIVPVDYVAKALAWSSRQEETAGRVLHHCGGPDMALDLMEVMGRAQSTFRAAGRNIPKTKIIPLWLFRSALPLIALLVSGKAKRAMKVLPVFFDYLQGNRVFENRQTRSVMAAAGQGGFVAEAAIEKTLLFYVQKG